MTTAVKKRTATRGSTKRAPQKKRFIPSSVKTDGELQRFLESPLFGLWSAREDIADPAEWVRSIRKSRAFDVPDGENAS